MKKYFLWLILVLFFNFSQTHGQVTVSGSIGVNGTYTSLSAAFAAINGAAAQTGANIFLNLTSSYNETGAATALTYKNWSSLTIQPTGSVGIGGTPTNHIIGFNGARFVTIDGLNSGGNSFTINSIGTNPAIVFYNGASNIRIKNAIINSNSNSLTAGVIFFSNATAGGDNNILIDNCSIGAASSGNAVNLVYSNGSAAAVNRSDTIRNCTLHDNFNPTGNSNGILLDANNDSWVIEGNHFYQGTSRTTTSGTPVYAAININGCLGDNFKIHNNFIGGTTASHTGYTAYGPTSTSPAFKGIILNNAGPAVAAFPSNSYVTNNTIKGIQINSGRSSTVKGNNVFVGIEVSNGATTDAAYITNNTIGGSGTDLIKIEATSTTANQVPCIGIYNRSSRGNFIDNNQIGSVSMYETSASAKTTTFSAIYADPLSNSITSISDNNIGTSGIETAYSAARVYGIELANTNASGTSYNIFNNSITNLTHTASSVTLNYPLAGINCVGGGDQVNIGNNTISSLYLIGSIPTTDVYIAGIRALGQTGAGAQPNKIYSNRIFALNTMFNTNDATGVLGISLLGASTTHYVYNNMICVGENSSGSRVLGINQNGSNTAYLYNNSIYITGVANIAKQSACVRKFAAACTMIAINNIFKIDGPGYAVSFTNTPVNTTPYTANYNIFNAPTGNAALIVSTTYPTLANFRTGLPAGNSEGAGSKESDVSFPLAPAYLSTQDADVINAGMNLLTATPLAITDDYEGEARNACFDIGADEIYLRSSPRWLTWTGTVDNKWCTPCNWDGGITPDSLHTVFLDAGNIRYPIIDATHNCVATVLPHADTLNIAAGASLTINGAALEIYGNLNNFGTLSNTGGSIGFTSSIKSQQINSATYLVFSNMYIKGLNTLKFLNQNTTVNNFAHCASCGASLWLGGTNLTVNNTATGSLSSHIVTDGSGNLIMKNITGTARLFPFGPADPSKYNPLIIANGGGKDYSARVSFGILPAGNTNPLFGINRTWNITASAAPGLPVDVTFHYYDADANVNCNPHSNMYLGHYYTTPVPAWNIDQGNQPVTVGAPNKVSFNINNWNASNPFIVGNTGILLNNSSSITLTGVIANNTALLSWNCADNNVLQFVILRSSDGLNFTTTATVSRVNGITDYNFTDQYLQTGNNFYKIMIVKAGGAFSYSNIVLLQHNDIKGMVGIRPSVVSSSAELLLYSTENQRLLFAIIDLQGRELYSGKSLIHVGNNVIPLALNNLPPGTYFIKTYLSNNDKTVLRFIKL